MSWRGRRQRRPPNQLRSGALAAAEQSGGLLAGSHGGKTGCERGGEETPIVGYEGGKIGTSHQRGGKVNRVERAYDRRLDGCGHPADNEIHVDQSDLAEDCSGARTNLEVGTDAANGAKHLNLDDRAAYLITPAANLPL